MCKYFFLGKLMLENLLETSRVSRERPNISTLGKHVFTYIVLDSPFPSNPLFWSYISSITTCGSVLNSVLENFDFK